jgi:hypothetical protein
VERFPVAPRYSFSFESPAYLLLMDGQLAPAATMPAASPQSQVGVQAVSSVIAARTIEGNRVYVAANRVGLIPLTIDAAAGVVTVLPALASPYFSGRVFGSMAMKSDGLACLLYVDDMASGTASDVAGAPGPPADKAPGASESAFIFIPFGGGEPGEIGLESSGILLEKFFGLFPSSAQAWFIQTRAVKESTVSSAYYRYDPASGQANPVPREDFERGSLRPDFMLPESLRDSAIWKSYAVSVVGADGSRFMTRAGSGDPAESLECYLAYDQDGAVLWLSRSGKGFYSHARSSGTFDVILPSPESVVVDLALSGNVAVIAWQEDFFPDVGVSGLIIKSVP